MSSPTSILREKFLYVSVEFCIFKCLLLLLYFMLFMCLKRTNHFFDSDCRMVLRLFYCAYYIFELVCQRSHNLFENMGISHCFSISIEMVCHRLHTSDVVQYGLCLLHFYSLYFSSKSLQSNLLDSICSFESLFERVPRLLRCSRTSNLFEN
ncbi:unnamed protein product [Vicia faba]|uniref:Uncharacterized protein n=1 Tax=Vicia faba TaxID=3906 RepID=A0AAV0ZGZ6_VICFA|nr:unnamed protein product [Vicia faba]